MLTPDELAHERAAFWKREERRLKAENARREESKARRRKYRDFYVGRRSHVPMLPKDDDYVPPADLTTPRRRR